MKKSLKYGLTLLTPEPGYKLVRIGSTIPMSEVILSLKDSEKNYMEVESEIFEEKEETDIPITPDMDLQNVKTLMIMRSNYNLKEYLKTHKVPSTAKGGVTKYYTATMEKQSLLTMQLMQAQFNGSKIFWNAAGEECEEWTVDEIKILSKDIEDFVRPLVSKQQKMETAITKAKTIAECLAVVVTFNE